MSASVEATPIPDLESEAVAPPKQRELAYIRITPAAKLSDTESVYLSRNRKAFANDGAKSPVYATCEIGRASQQSISYRAFAAMLTHDVVPMTMVVKRYVNSGRLDELATLVDAWVALKSEPDTTSGEADEDASDAIESDEAPA